MRGSSNELSHRDCDVAQVAERLVADAELVEVPGEPVAGEDALGGKRRAAIQL